MQNAQAPKNNIAIILKKLLTFWEECVIIYLEDLLPSEITLRVQIKIFSNRRLSRSAQVLRSFEYDKSCYRYGRQLFLLSYQNTLNQYPKISI